MNSIRSIKSTNGKYHKFIKINNLLYYLCNHAVGQIPVWHISSHRVDCKNCLKNKYYNHSITDEEKKYLEFAKKLNKKRKINYNSKKLMD